MTLVPEVISELDLVLDGIGATDPDYRGIIERTVGELYLAAIMFDNMEDAATPYDAAAGKDAGGRDIGQHARGIMGQLLGCSEAWREAAERSRNLAAAFRSRVASGRADLMSRTERVILTTPEILQADAIYKRILALGQRTGMAWERDARILGQTGAISPRHAPDPMKFVTLEHGHIAGFRPKLLKAAGLADIIDCAGAPIARTMQE